MNVSKVVATGQYLPDTRLTNTQFIEKTGIDSTDEWIVKRTGVQARRFAEGESVAEMATQAARDILSQINQEDWQAIRLIIVASMSSNAPTPSVANQVQANLSINNAWGFDISGACSGFTMALDIAERTSRTYDSGYILVIGVDKMSQILDLTDRSSNIIFGDGAGGLLIECNGMGLPNYQSKLVAMKDDKMSITFDVRDDSSQYLGMKGRDVFNFVNREVIPSIDEFIDSVRIEFDYLISHQANERLLDLMSQKLKVSRDKIPSNISEVANTSSASIPILLDDLVKSKQITLSGEQSVVLTGFGGGLAYGINYFKL